MVRTTLAAALLLLGLGTAAFAAACCDGASPCCEMAMPCCDD
jgi:hypothetical protein